MGADLYWWGRCQVCGTRDFRLYYDRKLKRPHIICDSLHVWECPWPRSSIGKRQSPKSSGFKAVGERRGKPSNVVQEKEA